MKITRKWCFILYHLYFPLKVQVIAIKENLAFKGRRPHLVRTIDDTSLPQDIRDPNISFADFSESARWWSPWSALVGWALLHQTHQNLTKLRSSKSIDQSVIFVKKHSFSLPNLTCILWQSPLHLAVVAGHRCLQRDRSSRWEFDLDSSISNFAIARKISTFRNRKVSVIFRKNSVSVYVGHTWRVLIKFLWSNSLHYSQVFFYVN